MNKINSSLIILKRHNFRQLLNTYQHSANYLTVTSDELYQFGDNDIGKLYCMPNEHVQAMGFHTLYLPKSFSRQIRTFHECVWMFRKQTFEAFQSIQTMDPDDFVTRLVFWGKYGTGKTITLYQLAHLAFTQGFILITVPDAMKWSRDNYYEVQASAYKQGRINSPHWAIKILKTFKWQNSVNWTKLSELKTIKKYQWSQVECTEEGKPITDIVEMGITAPYLATDCVGALGKELRIHATNKKIKLFVAIDNANGLYDSQTVVKKADRRKAKVEELSLTIHLRKFLMPIWKNGICAMVADKALISNSDDTLSVPPDDPETLFGDEGFEQIRPFVSVNTSLYTEGECHVIYNYFLEKNWISQSDGPEGNEAKKHLIYLSAFNPAYFDRICAMSQNLKCTVPIIHL